jgi:hypothetical protein
VVEHLVDAEAAVFGVAAGGVTLGGGKAAYEGDGVGAQGSEGGQGGAGVGAAMAKARGPSFLIPRRDGGARLGGDLADAEAERDLAVEQMGEDLDDRPFARLGAAAQARTSTSRRGPGDQPRAGGQRGQDRGAAEAVVGRSAQRASRASHRVRRRL